MQFLKVTGYVVSFEEYFVVCVSGDKKCSFFGKFGVLCFLETPVLRFALLRYYRRFALIDEYSEEFEFNANL